MQTNFEFRQIRDFGLVISHSFDFIKLEYKRLGKALLLYVLPFLVVTGILQFFVQISFVNNFTKTIPHTSDPFAVFKNGSFFISYLLQALNYTVMSSVIFLFIKLHQEKNGDFEIEQLWPALLKTSVKLLIALFITSAISIAAMIFLLVPCIYLATVLSLVGPIIVIEEASLGTAMSRSFTLIKENWWKTFGVIIIGCLILYIFTIVLSIPLIIVTAFKTFSAISNKTSPELFSSGYFVANTVISVFQTLGYSLMVILISIQYFSLVELKERPSLQDKVDQLASDNA
ncbi:hypothetical protein [Mangrovibacterium marinum]|uniref:DUF7847 domain-containing protein n=1 Tax=Mangrovibacterium marinum TaxID=1639118 RepID=A0A2T5BZ99_9BACT|nr:hypothetical protein [Mangrovibacterium marinum]PTN07593.1 hypothetical protein C8N47_11532 [Mangrovibacterium marinum]